MIINHPQFQLPGLHDPLIDLLKTFPQAGMPGRQADFIFKPFCQTARTLEHGEIFKISVCQPQQGLERVFIMGPGNRIKIFNRQFAVDGGQLWLEVVLVGLLHADALVQRGHNGLGLFAPAHKHRIVNLFIYQIVPALPDQLLLGQDSEHFVSLLNDLLVGFAPGFPFPEPGLGSEGRPFAAVAVAHIDLFLGLKPALFNDLLFIDQPRLAFQQGLAPLTDFRKMTVEILFGINQMLADPVHHRTGIISAQGGQLQFQFHIGHQDLFQGQLGPGQLKFFGNRSQGRPVRVFLIL